MNIGILGSAMVGQVVGQALVARGHRVVLGTRRPDDLQGKRGMAEPLGVWLGAVGEGGRVASFADAAAHGEVLINATAGTGSVDALRAAAAHLDGKILMDLANPLDFSHGMPPTLTVCNTDSLGEQIQRAFPRVKVVKTLNTTTAYVMVDPGRVGGGRHTMFVCGNDPDARTTVAGYLRDWFGWREVIDLGDLTAARGTEMILPLWVRLWGALQTPMFNFRIVREGDA